jgi:YfiH family protein
VGDDPAAVVANRSALAAELGVAPENVAFMHPDHGRGVAVRATGTGVEPGSEVRDVDALVTDRPGVALVALAADCVPVLLADPGAAVVAAVHSGWRGVALDVVGAALDAMAGLGAKPGQVVAHLGPAICGRCYAVPAQRAAEVGQVRPEAVTRARDGQPALDLRAGIAARLREAGAEVHLVGGCTAESAASYSHRRDGLTGRQAGVIVMLPTGGRP